MNRLLLLLMLLVSGCAVQQMEPIDAPPEPEGIETALLSTSDTNSTGDVGEVYDTRKYTPFITTPAPSQSWEESSAITSVDMTDYLDCGRDAESFITHAWSANGLPAGVAINSSTGVVSGTPTVGDVAFNATITCDNQCTGSGCPDDTDGTIQLVGDVNDTGTTPPLADGYYVRSTGDDTNTGLSDAQAFETAAAGFAACETEGTSCDLYFYVGETFSFDAYTVGWNGTSGDHATIGCYEISGSEIECNSKTDRATLLSTATAGSALTVSNGAYIDFKNIDWDRPTLASNNVEAYHVEVTDSHHISFSENKCHPFDSRTEVINSGGYGAQQTTCFYINDTSDWEFIDSDFRYYGFYGVRINGDSPRGLIQGGDIRDGFFDSIRLARWSELTSFDYDLRVLGNSASDMLNIGGSVVSDGFQSTTQGTQTIPTVANIVFRWINCTGDTSENCLDLKGGHQILVDQSILSGSIGDDSGDTNGNDRYSMGSAIHGGATLTDHVLFRDVIVYNNGTGGWLRNGWNWVNPTIVGNGRDYTGTNSSYTDNDDKATFMGLEGSRGGSRNEGSVVNALIGDHNHVEITIGAGWDGHIDYNCYFRSSGTPLFHWWTSGTGVWNQETTNFSAWQTDLGNDSGTTGDDANSTATCVPDFVSFSADPTGDYFTQNYDVSLDTGSTADGIAGPVTYANGAGTNSTSLTVDNACVVWAGEGITGETAEYIRIDTETFVQITARDCDSDIITLAASRTWVDNDPIYRTDSSGNLMDDLGACQTTNGWCP